MGFLDRLRDAMKIADDAAASGTMPADKLAAAARRSPRERKLLDELRDADEPATPIRLHLLFSGDVQGVGFRWTNQGLARDAGLAGWARNENDGTVTMEIQGRPAAIAAHLDGVHDYYRRFGNRIWLEATTSIPVQPGDTTFDVRY